MTRRRLSSGSEFERRVGYSRVVCEDDWIFVSGCTGFDYQTMEISEDIVEQTEQTFSNVHAALRSAGSSFGDVVRIRIIVADMADYPAVMDLIGRHCREVKPANTTWQGALVDPRMKIEIEVTAKRSPAETK